MRHNITKISIVMTSLAMTISSCNTQKSTFPEPVNKVATVSPDSVYTDLIQIPFDSKGANVTVKMSFDEPSNILTVTLIGSRNVFVFYEDTYYRKVFHKKILGHRVMNPDKLSYPALAQPGTKFYLSKDVKKSFPVPKGVHLFNKWLSDYSATFTPLDPIKTASGYRTTTLVSDSIVQRFAVRPDAKEGYITLRNILIMDKYSEKKLSKKDAAAFGALLPDKAKKAMGAAKDKAAAAVGKVKKAATSAASKAPKQLTAAAGGAAKKATAGLKPNLAMIKTTKPIKWIFSCEKDVNTTYYVKLQRNPCFGLDEKRDSSLKAFYAVRKAYRGLLLSCPSLTVTTLQDQQIFRLRKQFLRSKYLESTETSTCPEIQANINDYNKYVDSIRNVRCVYQPPLSQTDAGSKALGSGVSPRQLLDAAHRLDNVTTRYTISFDNATLHDIVKVGMEIIALMNTNIKEKGILNDEQRAALAEYRKAEAFFRKIVLKQ